MTETTTTTKEIDGITYNIHDTKPDSGLDNSDVEKVVDNLHKSQKYKDRLQRGITRYIL